MNIFRFQQQHTDETVPSQTSSQSGLIVWLVVHVLRRQEQQRRNTLTSQSRRNTMMNDNALPSISETMTAN
jgi:hypothetical protein